MTRMARMARLYDSHGSLARIDNGHYSAHLHAPQHELSTASEEQFPYSVDQENPVASAIHELGQRLVSNSEMMERRINKRF